jgi:hypothetical protein
MALWQGNSSGNGQQICCPVGVHASDCDVCFCQTCDVGSPIAGPVDVDSKDVGVCFPLVCCLASCGRN